MSDCGICVYMKRGAAGENFMIFTLKMHNLSASQFFLRQIFGSQKLQGGASSPLSPPLATPLGQTPKFGPKKGRNICFMQFRIFRQYQM